VDVLSKRNESVSVQDIGDNLDCLTSSKKYETSVDREIEGIPNISRSLKILTYFPYPENESVQKVKDIFVCMKSAKECESENIQEIKNSPDYATSL
ncbi:unnamed protein product, partial [Hymenolepis diminuta]